MSTAQPTVYSFDLQEATIALLKHQGIHEGEWVLNFEVTLTAGLLGPNPEQSRPSALMQIQKVQLVRKPADAPSTPLVVNAAIENPPGASATGDRKSP
jgi:hypothetical protein